MTKKLGKINVGTSGWSYIHWKDNFYPKKLKSTDWLKYYTTVFNTVEINSTFYRLPQESTVKNWFKCVSDNFCFSVKASRYITHLKRLNDCEESLKLFFKILKKFKHKIGPILFQLPPSFKLNQERLIEFINLLSDDYQYVFEFRHASWFCEEIYTILSKKNICLCLTDLNGKLSPEKITADFTYIRLHGPKKAYQGSYSSAELRGWKKKITNWSTSGISVYCYFDNDEKGYAVQDAQNLKDSLTKKNK